MAPRSLGGLTGLRGPFSRWAVTVAVYPVRNQMLEQTPSVAYVPKTSGVLWQQRRRAVTESGSRCRGLTSLRSFCTEIVPYAICARLAARQSYASQRSRFGRKVAGMSAGRNAPCMAKFRALTDPCQPGSLDGVAWTSIPAQRGLPEGRKWGTYV